MGFWDFLKQLFSGFRGQPPQPLSAPRPLPADRAAVVSALDPSPFGLNSHQGPPAYLERFADAGIRWHRVDINWNEIQRQQVQFDWAALDAVVDTAQQRSLSLLGVIAYTPAWAVPAIAMGLTEDVRRTYPPQDPATYLAFVDAVLGRYDGRFKALSCWNEPNIEQFLRASRDQYLSELLLPGLRRIREKAPSVATAGPDLSSSGRPLDFLGPVLDAAGDLLDVITHHQYDGGDTPNGRAADIDRVRELIVSRGLGDRQLWITETGWDVPGTARDRDAQARLLGQMLAETQNRTWWNKTFWYDSHGLGWGLLGADGQPDAGTPYAAFTAYKDLISNQQRA